MCKKLTARPQSFRKESGPILRQAADGEWLVASRNQIRSTRAGRLGRVDARSTVRKLREWSK